MAKENDIAVAERLEGALRLFGRGSRYKMLVDVHYEMKQLPDWYPHRNHGLTPQEQALNFARQVYFEIGTESKGIGIYHAPSYKGLPDDLDEAKKFIEEHYDVSGVAFGTVPVPIP